MPIATWVSFRTHLMTPTSSSTAVVLRMSSAPICSSTQTVATAIRFVSTKAHTTCSDFGAMPFRPARARAIARSEAWARRAETRSTAAKLRCASPTCAATPPTVLKAGTACTRRRSVWLGFAAAAASTCPAPQTTIAFHHSRVSRRAAVCLVFAPEQFTTQRSFTSISLRE